MVLKATQSARFKGRRARKLRRVCEDALDELGWNWEEEDRWTLVASVPRTFRSFGEWLIVEIHDEELFVISHCRKKLQLVDWGKNRHNVNTFLDKFEDILDDE